MKVLHLGKFYPPAKGGMETILALICERTAQHVAESRHRQQFAAVNRRRAPWID